MPGALALCLLVAPFAVEAQQSREPYRSHPRPHGLILDEKNRLMVVEDHGEATIFLLKKERAPGGPTYYVDESTGEGRFVVRFETRDGLFRIRSEVLFPAMPNYVRNPGQRYRITIEGLRIAPLYKRVFEVDAANALDEIEREVGVFAAFAHGPEQEAVFVGGLLAKVVLNESGYLPARIPLTVLRSRVGRFRIQGGGLGRAEQPRVERFAPVEEGGQIRLGEEMTTAPKPLFSMDIDDITEANEAKWQPSRHLVQQHRPQRRLLEPPDMREERMRPIRDPEPDRNQLGRPGRALTDRGDLIPPLVATQQDTLEILKDSRNRSRQRRGIGPEPEADGGGSLWQRGNVGR